MVIDDFEVGVQATLNNLPEIRRRERRGRQVTSRGKESGCGCAGEGTGGACTCKGGNCGSNAAAGPRAARPANGTSRRTMAGAPSGSPKTSGRGSGGACGDTPPGDRGTSSRPTTTPPTDLADAGRLPSSAWPTASGISPDWLARAGLMSSRAFPRIAERTGTVSSLTETPLSFGLGLPPKPGPPPPPPGPGYEPVDPGPTCQEKDEACDAWCASFAGAILCPYRGFCTGYGSGLYVKCTHAFCAPLKKACESGSPYVINDDDAFMDEVEEVCDECHSDALDAFNECANWCSDTFWLAGPGAVAACVFGCGLGYNKEAGDCNRSLACRVAGGETIRPGTPECDVKYQDCIAFGPAKCQKVVANQTQCQRCWDRCNAGDSPSKLCKDCKF
jgi:hypothetical protein